MILPHSVDSSCRRSRVHIKINAKSRKNNKAYANRRFRRTLKGIIRNVESGKIDWDEIDFGNLPTYTNWDID